MRTKPCARAGCTGLASAITPSAFARRRFCSVRCASLERVRLGDKPPSHPRAYYVAIGRAGGSKGGEKRRKRAAMQAAADLQDLIPKDMEVRMGRTDYARVVALLARAWLRGRKAEASASRMARQAARQTEAA